VCEARQGGRGETGRQLQGVSTGGRRWAFYHFGTATTPNVLPFDANAPKLAAAMMCDECRWRVYPAV
jgi:hypothetical protein